MISVILPTHNHAAFLPEMAKHLRSQTYRDWECIVVDDGSSDDTSDIVRRFAESDSRFRYVYQKHQGLSSARNEGLRRAQGEYIQFLDADDALETQKFEKQLALLQAEPSIDIVYGGVYYFGDVSRPKLEEVIEVSEEDEALDFFVNQNIAPVNCFLVRKSILAFVEAFDRRLQTHEDWDFWISCALRGARFCYRPIDGTRAGVCLRPGSMISNKRRMLQGRLAVRLKLSLQLSQAHHKKHNYRLIFHDGIRFAASFIRP